MELKSLTKNLNRNEESAPFNLALNTLERIAKIIQQMTEISIRIADQSNSDDINLMHIKYALLKHLYIQASPLFQKQIDQKKLIKDMVYALQLQPATPIRNSHGTMTGYSIAYDPKIDKEMDDIVEEIQTSLQKEGYFMPLKSDPGKQWQR